MTEQLRDLSQNYVRKEVAEQIIKDIDDYAVRTYDDGPRTHLGASLIGAPCVRETWYSWRWMGGAKFDGRMQRLFNRGHREEDRFIEYIRGIGGEVWPHDPNTGKQFRVSRVNGHFGGSLDGIVRLPLRYNCGTFLALGEFKTKGAGKDGKGAKFDELKEKGIMLTNPQHYDQMSTYGWNYNLELSVYFAVNKNDERLHVELVPLNFKRAAEVEGKAEYIIASQVPPPKIAQVPTFTKCKYCNYKGICHFNEVPDKNCRSCQYAIPVADGQWFCSGWQRILTPEVIRAGCDQWTFIR